MHLTTSLSILARWRNSELGHKLTAETQAALDAVSKGRAKRKAGKGGRLFARQEAREAKLRAEGDAMRRDAQALELGKKLRERNAGYAISIEY